ncbi:MAG: cytochrome c [Chthoniobacterales bacterium]|nr:cytochrome c [Chthoniobacterales bacterium]
MSLRRDALPRVQSLAHEDRFWFIRYSALCSLCLGGLLFFLVSCRQDMYNQPKAKPYSESNFFRNGTSARPLPAHTVEYHQARENEPYYTGLTNGLLVAQLPAPLALTPELLERGRERYDIHCAVCHGLTGEGNGEVVQRGFPAPPTYHNQRLRQAPLGHFYDVITNGYGVMYPYASRVAPNDRWAIAAYIRALQLSREARVTDLPPNEQKKLEEEQ